MVHWKNFFSFYICTQGSRPISSITLKSDAVSGHFPNLESVEIQGGFKGFETSSGTLKNLFLMLPLQYRHRDSLLSSLSITSKSDAVSGHFPIFLPERERVEMPGGFMGFETSSGTLEKSVDAGGCTCRDSLEETHG